MEGCMGGIVSSTGRGHVDKYQNGLILWRANKKSGRQRILEHNSLGIYRTRDLCAHHHVQSLLGLGL